MNVSMRALATIVGTIAATEAAAQTQVAPAIAGGGKSVIVSYADLDLGGPEGVRVLDGRIRNATRTVCGGAPEREISREVIRRGCYEFAMEGVRLQLAAARADQYAKSRSVIVVADSRR